MNPENLFKHLCGSRSDINEHLPTLRRLARGLRVVELGVRQGVSTVALLCGRPISYIGYDINPAPANLKAIAEELDVTYEHRVTDVYAVTQYPECDMLFIDTLHNGGQLQYELSYFGAWSKQYIVMHDVVSFGYSGETIPHDGLCPMLFQFLSHHHSWELAEWYTNNNGLAVLRRRP